MCVGERRMGYKVQGCPWERDVYPGTRVDSLIMGSETQLDTRLQAPFARHATAIK